MKRSIGWWHYLIVLFLPCPSTVTAFAVPQSRQSVRFRQRASNDDNDQVDDNFNIQQVSNRQQALDVMVFRSFRVTAAEYQQQWLDEHDGESSLSEQEAVERLTPTVDENGRDTSILGGPLVTFVVVCNTKDDDFERTHGVVAAVDAKLNQDHVYLKNLDVDERVRRRGSASALVTAVKDYTKASPVDEIVLHVERPTNVNAIALYEKEGFEFQEEREGDGRMTFKVDKG
jgi:ribosomal protein S18 acetylase RimI-like enzyme